MNHKTRLLVLQATSFCNLNCSYCYLSKKERNTRSKMSIKIVAQTAKFLRESDLVGDTLSILWHAGEPMTLPVNYYRNVIKEFTDILGSNVSLKFSLQTNAIGLNDEWCDFLCENDIGIGVSIDGPKFIHDTYRKTKSDKETFDLTMKGINKLKENEIPFSTISVITKKSLGHADKIVDFLIDLESMSIGMNPEEIECYNNSSSLINYSEELRKFIKDVYTRFEYRGELKKSREIRQNMNNIIRVNNIKKFRKDENIAFKIVTVSTDGRISTFSPELCGFSTKNYGDFTFGHVSGKIEDILNNKNFVEASSEIDKGVLKCKKTCNYYKLCGGGSPSNKLQENGTFNSSETKHCEHSTKYFLDNTINELMTTK